MPVNMFLRKQEEVKTHWLSIRNLYNIERGIRTPIFFVNNVPCGVDPFLIPTGILEVLQLVTRVEYYNIYIDKSSDT